MESSTGTNTIRHLANRGASPSVFSRREKKYLLAPGMDERLLAMLGEALVADGHGPARIHNLYLDTASHLLIRRSIEKPDFKEKFRVRAYGDVMDEEHPVFLETKKKYRSAVYKRRVRMTLREARRFVEHGVAPHSPCWDRGAEKAALNRQILDEMRWSFAHYGRLSPSFSVEYGRRAYAF
jgi:hypothetical protein